MKSAKSNLGKERIVWHYTAGTNHFQGILGDRVIKLSTILVDRGERPAVWFSQSPLWERTATVDRYWSIRPTEVMLEEMLEEMLSDGIPLMRIAVLETTAPVRWKDFKRTSGISFLTAKSLEKSAYDNGSNPWLWRCSFAPVPFDDWVSVEVYQRIGWTDTGILKGLRERMTG